MIEKILSNALEKSVEINIKDISPSFDTKLDKDVSPNFNDTKLDKDGGAYKDLYTIERHEKHHMPADSTNDLNRGDGPAIVMEKEDHRETASCGNSKEAQEYRAEQKELIDKGLYEEAFEMDVKDIKEKFSDKYDKQIDEARKYMQTLDI